MKKLVYLICLMMSFDSTFGQDNPTLESIGAAALQQTISDLKSGNTHDILTNAFQASINDLLGSDKEFSFKSTLYGIDSTIFKDTSDLDIYYRRQKISRKSEISLNIKGNDSNVISTYGLGLKFSPVDKKDITYADYSKEGLPILVDKIAILKKKVTQEIETTLIGVYGETMTADGTESKVDSIMSKIQDSYSQFGQTQDLSQLHSLILANLTDEDKITFKSLSLAYDSLAIIYSRKPLWTVSGNFNYDYINKLPELKFESEFTVGLGNNIHKRPWEFEITGKYLLENDSISEGSDISSHTLSGTLGLNKILRENLDSESTMELKLYASYDYFLGTLPEGVNAGLFTANSTFRILAFKQFWIPITLKYDVENANLFGFISLTANLE